MSGEARTQRARPRTQQPIARGTGPRWSLLLAGALVLAAAWGLVRFAPALRDAGSAPATLPRAAGPEPLALNDSLGEPEPPHTTGPEDGVIADSASPFDVGLPAVSRLDPELLRAVQRAARDANAAGVEVMLTSGWRSPAYQQQLFDEAVAQYGSVAEALRYVATPQTSSHVTGRAVDIGPAEADRWLMRNGARYGLCQRFANEAWHFELLTEPGGECPPLLADASP